MMMEPIISPWIIYALHVFDKVYIACQKKINKILLKIAAISAIVLIIVPDKDTLIAMMATSYITPDNIQAAQGNVVEFIRQIIEVVQNGK